MDSLPNSTGENIKVIVRIKPNVDKNIRTFLTNNDKLNSIVVGDKTQFIFDKVAGSDTTQEDMFESSRSLFQSFIDGYNATLFAYGQTGSGKTFTMTGDSDETGSTKNPGLIPRALNFIFDKVNERALNNSVEYLIKCTFVEIYNEQIYDLLDPQLQKLSLRFGLGQEVFLEPCTEIVMENPKVADEILKRGLSNRHMASTEMNRESSRSHAVFTIVLESRESQDDIAKIKKSCLHLVDLAGSERQRDTKTDGVRLKEACMINKSLFALSMVIRKLVEAAKSKKPPHVGYRDSKLTTLLKDSIGGNSKTSVVACIQNDFRFMTDTFSTLQFANNVKMIVNKAKINLDTQGDNEALQKEINLLREQLERTHSPEIISEREFDFDLVWKKRFITAMALRSNLCLDVSAVTNELATANLNHLELHRSINNLKLDLELKEKKMTFLEQRYRHETIDEDVIKVLIDTTLRKLEDQANDLKERIQSGQLQMQVTYLSNELSKAAKLNSIALGDKTIIHSLLSDYNNIIQSGDFNTLVNTDVETANLKFELSQSNMKYSRLKKKLLSTNIINHEEKRKLEAELYTLKTNLKVVEQQCESAVVDRRKTLLSVHELDRERYSPLNNFRGINCRRRTQKKPVAAVLEDIESSDDFCSAEEFFKKNADDLSYLDKVSSLEKELRESQIKIGSMEYSLNENKKEIEELKNDLQLKQNLEYNLQDTEIKLHDVRMALEDSGETVKRLQKEIGQLEISKDKTIKILSEKNFCLDEEIISLETDKIMYKEKLETVELSMLCMKEEMKTMEESLMSLQNENSKKTTLIDSQILDKDSIYEEIVLVKEELLNTKKELDRVTEIANRQMIYTCDLKKQVDEYKANEYELSETLKSLGEEVNMVRNDNNSITNGKEKMETQIAELQNEIEFKATEHRNLIVTLEDQYKERENELLSSLEESRYRVLHLTDELQLTNNKLYALEQEKKTVKPKLTFTSPIKGFQMSIPDQTLASSPRAMLLIKDSNSRSNLINDIMSSEHKMEQELKKKSKIIQKIKEILDSLFEELHLQKSESIVENMTAIQSAIISYRQDIDDLVVKKLEIETELKRLNDMRQILDCDLTNTRNQRDKLKTEFEDLINMMPNGGHTNSRQRISYFKQYKDENARYRRENLSLIDQNNEFRIWLIQNNFMKLYESSVKGGDVAKFSTK